MTITDSDDLTRTPNKIYCGGVDWDEDEDPDIYEDPEIDTSCDDDDSWDDENEGCGDDD